MAIRFVSSASFAAPGIAQLKKSLRAAESRIPAAPAPGDASFAHPGWRTRHIGFGTWRVWARRALPQWRPFHFAGSGASALRSFTFVMLLLFLMAGCAGPDVHADKIAQSAGLQRDEVDTGDFVLTAFYRITRPDLPSTIYIEGDGLAWRTRYQPSYDPTPHQALGLALAAADTAPNVVYLARPCQFTPMAASPRCSVEYWTGKRYAEEVIVAMNRAISHYAALTPGQRINLVGYSGGGAVAVLVAARRDDVASLRTVGGNLDHVAVNRLHGVSAMPDSLNAIDVAQRIAAIPQIHFSGADDTVVPAAIAQSFVAAVGSACAQMRVVPGMSHESDWNRLWPGLLGIVPRCSAKDDR
jgi:pimeloyl-ACP methyl ester carboxylesterase